MKKHIQNAVIFLLVILIVAMTGLVSLLVYVCFFTDNTNMRTELKELEHAEYTEYDPSEINIKPLGRTSYSDGVRYASMSGSGVEFCCKGDYVTFDIHGVYSQYQTSNHKARFAVYLNNQQVMDEIADYDKNNFRLDISSYKDGVTVRIMKLSEAQYSSLGIGKIGVYGSYRIAPAPEKNLKIEFIGDSITCGYGLDEISLYGSFSTVTENFSKTYAYLTAQKLNADFSVVGFSGYGVYSGFTTGGRNSKDVISRYYETACTLPYNETAWNFSEFPSDLIVINLGTNDASYCSKSYSGRQNFTKAYVELIKSVRSKNPSAYILCVLGDMNNSLYPCIEQAVNDYTGETWDSRIGVRTISFDMGNTDVVIDGHPGVLANHSAANELTVIINELISMGKINREV